MIGEPFTETIPLIKTPEGAILVQGTRVSLDTIIYFFKEGETPESIARRFPTVSLANVHYAIAYYLDHKGEVEAYLEGRRIRSEKLRASIEARPGYQEFRDKVR